MTNEFISSEIKDLEVFYKNLKRNAYLNSDDLLLRRKLAYLALYLGHMEEAYRFSCSLDFCGSVRQQTSRQKSLELLLKKKESPRNSSQVVSGFFCKSEVNVNKITIKESLETKISSLWGWGACSLMSFRVNSLKSPRYIRNNIVPFNFEPGIFLDAGVEEFSHGKRVIGYWIYKGLLSFDGVRFPVVFKFDEYPDNEHQIDIFVEKGVEKALLPYLGEMAICYFFNQDEKEDSWLDLKIELYDIFSKKSQQFEKNLTFYQAHEDWGLAGLRPTKLRLSEYKIDKWLNKDKEVLDIGCNIGCFGIEVANLCKNYIGIDYNKDVIQVAKKLADYKGADNCKFENIGFFDFLEVNNKKYDFIFSFAVHGWIGLPMREYISIIKGMLNPGGMVLIESHDLVNDLQKKNFAGSMKTMIDLGFVLVDKGEIKDDGRRNRIFYTFALEEPSL